MKHVKRIIGILTTSRKRQIVDENRFAAVLCLKWRATCVFWCGNWLGTNSDPGLTRSLDLSRNMIRRLLPRSWLASMLGFGFSLGFPCICQQAKRGLANLLRKSQRLRSLIYIQSLEMEGRWAQKPLRYKTGISVRFFGWVPPSLLN